jgi:hypothetical protein
MVKEQSTDVPIIRPNGISSTMQTSSCWLLQANAAINQRVRAACHHLAAFVISNVKA